MIHDMSANKQGLYNQFKKFTTTSGYYRNELCLNPTIIPI